MIGILLVNLGTPRSPDPQDVWEYLLEFLLDPRVLDLPPLQRNLLVRYVIVPRRYRESAKAYQRIWTEEGSPLLVHGRNDQRKLQAALGPEYQVELAMRYGEPTIRGGLERLKGCEEVIVLPLFPQYAAATTGSIFEKVMEEMKSLVTFPHCHFIQSYPTEDQLVKAFSERLLEHNLEDYDEVLFSFHGLPERAVKAAHSDCLTEGCCKRNGSCYKAQCHRMMEAIASHANLKSYRICFQSRLGKEPWLTPDILSLKDPTKKQLVICPSFVSDCLETLDEIQNEYGMDLVTGLNSLDSWIACLQNLVLSVGTRREMQESR